MSPRLEFDLKRNAFDMRRLQPTLKSGEGMRDAHRARKYSLKTYANALLSSKHLAEPTSDYLNHIERAICLEARCLLQQAQMRADWTAIPLTDDGQLHDHLFVARVEAPRSCRNGTGLIKSVQYRLVVPTFVVDDQAYTFETLLRHGQVQQALCSVGNKASIRDLDTRSLASYDSTKFSAVGLNLGYIGDALNSLAAVWLINFQNRHSPLLAAVAAPSNRVVDPQWRFDHKACDALNADQAAALRGLAHNLEAVTGPPGTGKSTLIAAVVKGCAPEGSATMVAAVQNRAIESIVQKLASTAKTVPFVVHGTTDRLCPSSLEWTLEAQSDREAGYLRFLAQLETVRSLCTAIEQGIRSYESRVFPGVVSGARHAQLRKCLLARLSEESKNPHFQWADYSSPASDRTAREGDTGAFRKWFEAGGGDGMQKLVRVCVERRFPAAFSILEALTQRRSQLELRAASEREAARQRICNRSLALLCTCAAVGGLLRSNSTACSPSPIQTLAMRCSTLVVDEAGTCADSCLVGVLPYTETGHTFERLLLVGDAKQLPPFSRQRKEQVVSLIERVDDVVGSALLTSQYRMPECICRIVSNLYYGGRLVTQKKDPAGTVRVVHVTGTAKPPHAGEYSLVNEDEARECARLAIGASSVSRDVAILAFYKAQVRLIACRVQHVPRIRVLSVDSAQGQEFECVVLSCVADSSRSSFLRDERRMNVALSRAKHTLVVVCNPALSRESFCVAVAESI